MRNLRQLAVEVWQRLPFLPQPAIPMMQVEQLAQEIVAYRAMMNLQGYILVSVPEVASRFSETPHAARAALRLLESKGIAISTEYKDRWAVHQ